MAREPGTKMVPFSADEIAALGLQDAADFTAAVKERLANGPDILAGFDPDLQDALTCRAQGLGHPVPDVLNAMVRSAIS